MNFVGEVGVVAEQMMRRVVVSVWAACICNTPITDFRFYQRRSLIPAVISTR